jgi:hypothetical protein
MFTVSSPLAGISDLKLQLKKHEPIDPSAQAQIAWGVNTAAQPGEIFPSRSRGKVPPADTCLGNYLPKINKVNVFGTGVGLGRGFSGVAAAAGAKSAVIR